MSASHTALASPSISPFLGPIHFFNLLRTLPLRKITDAMIGLNDQAGESCGLKFGVEGVARYGVARAALDLDVLFQVQRLDSQLYSLSWDLEVAARLGLDVGFFTASGGIGAAVGGSAIFDSPDGAAAFLLNALLRLESKYFRFMVPEADRLKAQRDADKHLLFKVARNQRFANVEAEAGADSKRFGQEGILPRSPGVFGKAEYRVVENVYTNREQQQVRSTTSHTIYRVGASFNAPFISYTRPHIQNQTYHVSYERDRSTTETSPIKDENGEFIKHRVILEFPPGYFRQKISEADFTKSMRGLADKIGKQFKFSPKLGDKVTKRLHSQYKMLSRRRISTRSALEYQQLDIVDPDGQTRSLYDRWEYTRHWVEGSLGTNEMAGVKVEGDMWTSSVLAETVGGETVSYVRRAFQYMPEVEWLEFRQKNSKAIASILQRCADPSFVFHVPAVTQALQNNPQDFEGAWACLEADWRQSLDAYDKILPTASRIARYIDQGTGWLVSRSQQRSACIRLMASIRLLDDETQANILFHLSAYGIDLKELWQLLDAGGKAEEMQCHMQRLFDSFDFRYRMTSTLKDSWDISTVPVIPIHKRPLDDIFLLEDAMKQITEQYVMPRDGTLVAPAALPLDFYDD